MPDMSIAELREHFYADYATGKLYRKSNDKEVGGVTSVGCKSYYRFRHNKKQMYTHRAVYALAHGYYPKIIDHKNGDSLCNCLDNLEGHENNAANMRNRKGFRNESVYGRGIRVQKNKRTGAPTYWMVSIMHNGVRHFKSFHIEKENSLLEAQIWNLNKRYELGFTDIHCEGLIKAIQENPGYANWNPKQKQI